MAMAWASCWDTWVVLHQEGHPTMMAELTWRFAAPEVGLLGLPVLAWPGKRSAATGIRDILRMRTKSKMMTIPTLGT